MELIEWTENHRAVRDAPKRLSLRLRRTTVGGEPTPSCSFM